MNTSSNYSLTTRDVAQKYEYSERYVRRLAASGEIPSIQVGRGKLKKEYRFNPEETAQALAGRVLELECSEKADSSGEIDDLGV